MRARNNNYPEHNLDLRGGKFRHTINILCKRTQVTSKMNSSTLDNDTLIPGTPEMNGIENRGNSSETSTLYSVKIASVVASVIFVVQFTLACISNIIILLAMYKTESLKTKTYVLLANLSVLDIVKTIGLFSMLVEMLLGITGVSVGSNAIFCLSSLFATSLSTTASQWTLLLIAAERYIKIMHGLRYDSIVTSGRLRIVLLVLWGYLTCISSTIFYVNNYSSSSKSVPRGCEFDTVVRNPAHTLIILNLGVTLILILPVYSAVFRVAYAQKRKIQREESMFSGQQQNAQRQWSFPVLKMVCMLIGTQYLTFLPLIGVTIASKATSLVDRPSVYIPLKLSALGISFFNSIFNPVIYHYRDEKFREAFRKLRGIYLCKSNTVA